MEDRQHEGGVSSVLYNITSPDKEPRVHYWIQNMCIFRAVRAFLTKWKLAIPFVVCSRSETKQPIECQQKANWVRRTRHGRAGREKLSSEQEQQLYGPSCCGLRMPISRCYSFSKEVRTLEILNKKKKSGISTDTELFNIRFLWAKKTKWRQPVWILCQCVRSTGVSMCITYTIFNSSCSNASRGQ